MIHRHSPRRAFTLVELMIGMTLASMVMLGVLSTFLFMGRNSTRLSYQHALEIQSRTILHTLGLDVRNAKAIASASSTGMVLTLWNGTSVTYDCSTSTLTRDTGSGPVALLSDIKGEKVQVPVTLSACSFSFSTTTDGTTVSQFNSALVPLSIKQVAISFTLQAGNSVQAGVGTMTTFQIASGWLLFSNKQLPDGT